MPLTSGQTFAGYTIIRLLGSGGMGEVYLAQHPRLPRRDALKLLPHDWSADAEYRARFNREADLASTLWHPNIVGVHDRGEDDDQLWISMDYVEGLDAARLLASKSRSGLDPHQVANIVTAVAGALDHAHDRGLLHRDIKPANIMVTTDEQRILLADFGIVRSRNDISGLTATNFTVGTVAFAAPEQLMGEEIDGRADQYALAATAYNLLTGSHLFPNSNPAVVIGRHLNATPPTLSNTRPELAALDPVLAIALAKNPADRFRQCRDFAHALSLARVQARISDINQSATLSAINVKHSVPSAATVSAAKKPATSPKPVTGARKPPASGISGDSHTARRPIKNGSEIALRKPLALAAMSTVGVVAIGAIAWIGLHVVRSEKPAAIRNPNSSSIFAPPNVCADPTTTAAQLPIRDKLAQLLMVGVKNADDARAVVNNYHVGGILIGSWTDLSIFNGPLADIAAKAGPLPLAVSVDEEGGRVSRLRSLIGTAPAARTLAQTHTVAQVHDMAAERGKKMRDLGITIDFAPVVDVSDSPDDSMIGDRSFSSDPGTVTAYAGAYAQGLRDAGLLPVLKHFPGHGNVAGDSRTGAVVTPPLSDLQNIDLVPYRTLVTAAPVAVMVGHLEVPGLTGDDPASLSRTAVQLLRDGTGYGAPPFNGPVFSDDLSNAAAISDRYGVGEAALRTLQAGTDNALWMSTNEVPAVMDRLQKAVATGDLPMQRVDESLVRVATMKDPNRRCGQ
jgi:beta-N-acetylhexosaminidase